MVSLVTQHNSIDSNLVCSPQWESVLYHRSCREWSKENESRTLIGNHFLKVIVDHIAITSRMNLTTGLIQSKLKHQVRIEILSCLAHSGFSIYSHNIAFNSLREMTDLPHSVVENITAQVIGLSVENNRISWLYRILKQVTLYLESSSATPPRMLLQELAQKQKHALPEYEVIATSGEEHNKEFTVECKYKSSRVVTTGKSKKLAISAAAEKMLTTIGASSTAKKVNKKDGISLKGDVLSKMIASNPELSFPGAISRGYLIPPKQNLTTCLIPSRFNNEYALSPLHGKALSQLGSTIESFLVAVIFVRHLRSKYETVTSKHVSYFSKLLYASISTVHKQVASTYLPYSRINLLKETGDRVSFYEQSARRLLSISFLSAFEDSSIEQWVQAIFLTSWGKELSDLISNTVESRSVIESQLHLDTALVELQSLGLSYQFKRVGDDELDVQLVVSSIKDSQISFIVNSQNTNASTLKELKSEYKAILKQSLHLFMYKSSYTNEYQDRNPKYCSNCLKLNQFLFDCYINDNLELLEQVTLPSSEFINNPYRLYSKEDLLNKQGQWNELDTVQKAYLFRELRYRIGYDAQRRKLEELMIHPSIFPQYLLHTESEQDETKLTHKQQPNQELEENHPLPVIDAGKIALEPISDYEWSVSSGEEKDENVNKQSEEPQPAYTVTLESISDYEWSSDSNKTASMLDQLQVSEPNHDEVVSLMFRWPSTIAFEADGSLPEVEWPKIGVLKAVGYTVGAQGLPQADRRTILTNVYMQSLPYVDSRSYMNEWGEPLSSDRLKKMAETLASLTKGAKRKTQANMKQAIRDWESDLAWLKEQYYLEHKYLWVWPRSGNKDESDLELTIKEKHYQSSKEFLIEQYTNKANELCCQICQSALPFKLESGEYFWEEIPVTKSINSSPYSDLILCPNHRAMYLHTNSKPNQLLENLGDSFSKKLSIELASEQVSIFVTELHQKKLRLAKELMPRTKASSCLFDFSNIPQGLQGVKKLYLYENQGSWVVSSRAKVIATLKSKSEAKQWLVGFDEHRGVISTITEKVPTPKSKKTKQPKLKTRSSLSVAAVRFGTVKKAEPQSSYKSGYSLCTTCNGDGGINGGCWKCGGSGWM